MITCCHYWEHVEAPVGWAGSGWRQSPGPLDWEPPSPPSLPEPSRQPPSPLGASALLAPISPFQGSSAPARCLWLPDGQGIHPLDRSESWGWSLDWPLANGEAPPPPPPAVCGVTWSRSHLLGPRFPQAYSGGGGLDTPP